jgi:hypothetical protein
VIPDWQAMRNHNKRMATTLVAIALLAEIIVLVKWLF